MEIDLEHGRMRLLVPEDAAGQIGLRPVIDNAMVSRVLDVLHEEPRVLPDAWGARNNSYRQRLAAGDVLEVAALARDLEARSRGRNALSAIERNLLDTCRRQLVSELAVAMDVTSAHAEAELQSLVAGVDPV